jgi:hypothetical protein
MLPSNLLSRQQITMPPRSDIPWDKIKASSPDSHIPPFYYDSEPSSQPPKYTNTQAARSPDSPPATISMSKPAVPHRNHSAPANMVAAVLAAPNVDIDAQRRAERKSRTLRERMKGFWERNVSEAYQAAKNTDGSTSSTAELNVLGAKFTSPKPSSNRRQSKK